MTTDSESVALENARLSARGAVRRSHCIMTWLGKLRQLQAKGLAPDHVLKTWNGSCTQEARVLGNKRVALLQLLHFPSEIQEQLLQHASQFGDRGAFLEETRSNKKLAVGFTPRTAVREWNTRLQVTRESLSLMIRYVHTQHESKMPATRTKLGKEAVEEALAMCSLLLSLNEDLKQNLAVSQAVLEEQIVNKFIQGDSHLELELQSALSEKKAKFTHSDVEIYKELVKQHLATSSNKMNALGMATTPVTVAAAQLEKQEYELCLSNVRHDVQVHQVWFSRSLDREAAMYHQNLQHQQQRKIKAKEVASGILTAGHPQGKFQLEVLGNTTQTCATIRKAVEQIKKKEQLSTSDQVMTLTILNWAAPSMFSSDAQKVQAEVMGAMVNDAAAAGKNLGLLLCPVYCPKRGQLYKVEESANQRLAQCNICQDARFALPFQGEERRPGEKD